MTFMAVKQNAAASMPNQSAMYACAMTAGCVLALHTLSISLGVLLIALILYVTLLSLVLRERRPPTEHS